ncbi:hypothetical protein GGI17_000580 [Coemansia sp. S146]|nr:hypothetical protein GGI17_000580 [Coemansia sp. S146]
MPNYMSTSMAWVFMPCLLVEWAWRCLSILGLFKTTFLLAGAWGCWLVAAKVVAVFTTQAHNAAANRFLRQLRFNEGKSRVPRTVLDGNTDDDSSDDDDDNTEPSPLVNGTATDDSSDTEVPEPRTPVGDTSADGSRGVEGPARRDSKYAGPNFLAPRDTSAPELGDNTSLSDEHLEPSDIVVNDIPLQRVADKAGAQLDDPSDIDEDTARVFGGLVAQLATSHIHTIKQSADLVAPVITTEQDVVQANLIDNNDRIIDELATSSEQAAAPASIVDSNEGIDEVPPVNPDSDERAYEAAPNSVGAPHDELSTSSKQPAEQVSADGATEEAADTSIVVKTEQPKKPVQTTDAPEQRKKTSTDVGTTMPAPVTAKASQDVGGLVVNDAAKLSSASRSSDKVDAEAAEMDSARGSSRPTGESFVNNLGKESSGESESNRRSTVNSALDSIITEGSIVAKGSARNSGGGSIGASIAVQPMIPRSNSSVPAGGDTGMQVDTLSISTGVRREEPSISAGSRLEETSATDAVMQGATIVSGTGALRVVGPRPVDVEMEAVNPPAVKAEMEDAEPPADDDSDMEDEEPTDDDTDMEDEDSASDNNVQMEVYVPILDAASVEAKMEVLQRPHRQPRTRRPVNAVTGTLPPNPIYSATGAFDAGSFNLGSLQANNASSSSTSGAMIDVPVFNSGNDAIAWLSGNTGANALPSYTIGQAAPGPLPDISHIDFNALAQGFGNAGAEGNALLTDNQGTGNDTVFDNSAEAGALLLSLGDLWLSNYTATGGNAQVANSPGANTFQPNLDNTSGGGATQIPNDVDASTLLLGLGNSWFNNNAVTEGNPLFAGTTGNDANQWFNNLSNVGNVPVADNTGNAAPEYTYEGIGEADVLNLINGLSNPVRDQFINQVPPTVPPAMSIADTTLLSNNLGAFNFGNNSITGAFSLDPLFPGLGLAPNPVVRDNINNGSNNLVQELGRFAAIPAPAASTGAVPAAPGQATAAVCNAGNAAEVPNGDEIDALLRGIDPMDDEMLAQFNANMRASGFNLEARKQAMPTMVTAPTTPVDSTGVYESGDGSDTEQRSATTTSADH